MKDINYLISDKTLPQNILDLAKEHNVEVL